MEVLVADEEERMSARSAVEDFLEIDRCPGVEGNSFRSWDSDGWFSHLENNHVRGSLSHPAFLSLKTPWSLH